MAIASDIVNSHIWNMKTFTITAFLIGILFFSKAQQVNFNFPHAQNIKKIKTSDSSLIRPENKIFILGAVGADAIDISSLTTLGSISIGVRPSNRISGVLNFNLAGNIFFTESADTVLLSSFYFPDVGKSAFSGALEFCVFPYSKEKTNSNLSNRFYLTAEGSLQNRQILKDSVNYKLGVLNYNLGFKYKWYYVSDNTEQTRTTISIGALYNSIHFNNNNQSDFNSLFSDNLQQPQNVFRNRISGIGTFLSLQINNSTFYLRTFTDLNKSRDLDFTVGVKQNIVLKAF